MTSGKRLRVAFAAPLVTPVTRSSRKCYLRAHSWRMSGVNGGIDYEIDLNSVTPALARRVRYIQGGPDSPTELIAAARDLAAAAPTTPAMLPVLVDVLGFNNPVAADIAITALSQSGEAAVPSLLIGVGAFNYAVNAYALRALGRIGDPSVLPVVAACANQGPIPGVRRAACAALAGLRFTDKKSATEGFECLLRLADSEADWGVRYAAVVGIERFFARDFLEENVRAQGVNILQGILNGTRCISGRSAPNESDVTQMNDPTVIARATLALERLQEEVLHTA